jgi:hypothetical protein
MTLTTMPNAEQRATQIRRRMRGLTSLLAVGAGIGGLLALEGHHGLHGTLLLLASGVLFKGAVGGRRGPSAPKFAALVPHRRPVVARSSSSNP